jgi:soluble lytic murein transglycosylase-like protein
VHDAIKRAAARAGVDSNLLLAVAEAESGLRPDAVSPKGAVGLMQLMPSTAGIFGIHDAFDLEQNARGGAAYLRQLLDRFGGDVGLAVAAYNAGPGAVERYAGVPPYGETQRFVTRVLSRLSELGAPDL